MEDYLELGRKQVEMHLDNIRMDTEKKKGQIRWRDPKLQANCIESLEASPLIRPISILLLEDNSMFSPMCVTSYASALAHLRLCLRSQMENTCVYLDGTAFKHCLPSATCDTKTVWICRSGILHVAFIF